MWIRVSVWRPCVRTVLHTDPSRVHKTCPIDSGPLDHSPEGWELRELVLLGEPRGVVRPQRHVDRGVPRNAARSTRARPFLGVGFGVGLFGGLTMTL